VITALVIICAALAIALGVLSGLIR